MKKEIKEILLKFDEIGAYETPTNFDAKKLSSDVEKLKSEIESIFGFQFQTDDQVQDASFFCDIIVPNELVENKKPNYRYSIRISNFGKLVTLNSESSYSLDTISKLKQLFLKHDFNYIQSDDLECDYDGVFSDFMNILGGEKPSWWIRYFDYL